MAIPSTTHVNGAYPETTERLPLVFPIALPASIHVDRANLAPAECPLLTIGTNTYHLNLQI